MGKSRLYSRHFFANPVLYLIRNSRDISLEGPGGTVHTRSFFLFSLSLAPAEFDFDFVGNEGEEGELSWLADKLYTRLDTRGDFLGYMVQCAAMLWSARVYRCGLPWVLEMTFGTWPSAAISLTGRGSCGGVFFYFNFSAR